jgi:antitoxin component of RelBE/YafQ-DinJ toxin-antitoxin module
MAIKPKSAVLQIRLDPDLLRRFHGYAESLDMPTSMVVRRWMASVVDRFETPPSVTVQAAPVVVSKLTPTSTVVSLTRQQKRALERQKGKDAAKLANPRKDAPDRD